MEKIPDKRAVVASNNTGRPNGRKRKSQTDKQSGKRGQNAEFSNDDVRPILDVMNRISLQFKDLECRLQEKYELFEDIVESHDLVTLNEEAEEVDPLLNWLVGKDDDETDKDVVLQGGNPVGMYFGVAAACYRAYKELLGLDFENLDEVYTEEYLEAHPEAVSDDQFHFFEEGLANRKALKVLRKYEQFREHTDYGSQPLKDRQQNAIAELDAIKGEATRYMNLVERLQGMFTKAANLATEVYRLVSNEFSKTQDHHAAGNRIIKNPSLTSLVRVIFAKMDGIQQINQGLNPHEVSDHVKNNAARFLCALVDADLYQKVVDQNKIIQFAAKEVECLYGLLSEAVPLTIAYKKEYWRCIKESSYKTNRDDAVASPKGTLAKLQEIDFEKIRYKPSKRRKSKVELRTDDASNEAYQVIIQELDKLAGVQGKKQRFHAAKASVDAILRKRHQFKETTGALSNYYRCTEGENEQIILQLSDPPQLINPERILGLNFEEVRRHYTLLNSQQRYQAVAKLLSATGRISENFLLLGPPGCGKTELVRALGSEPQTIFVELRGSNLQSMWAGQTEKNPLRLFYQAEELSKLHKKRVNVFLDEAEAVLAPPQGYNEGTNKRVLSELNAILDGTHAFEGVNMIVALNSLDNILLSNMRRFQMYVVGELSLDDRARLLCDFVNRGLVAEKDLTMEQYLSLARMLQGATGVIARYPVDMIAQHFWGKLYKTKRPELEKINDLLVDDQGSFDVSKATVRQRELVKCLLQKNNHVVTYSLLKSAITKVMRTQSVQEQIKFAEDFYEQAKRETAQLRMSGLEVQL